MPRLGEKRSLHLSGTTVFRTREPTNPKVAAHFTQMVFDHSLNMPVVPADSSGGLGTAHATRGDHDVRTMNADGKSAVTLEAMLGGAPDYQGPIHHPGGINTTPPPKGGRQ